MRQRQFLAAAALIGLVLLGACARASSDTEKMPPGTPVTATMKDGSIVSGRLVELKTDAVVIDPAEGGEWKTLSRDQISSLTAQPPANTQAQPGATAPQAAPAPTNAPQPASGRVHGKAPAAAGGHRAANAPTPTAPGGRPAPAFREVTIPADTLLHVRLENHLASDTSHVEDPVSASFAKPVVVDDVEAVPEGSALKGVVTQAKPSGRVKGRAELAFRFDTLSVAGGDEQRVQTRAVGIEAKSTTKKDAAKIGIPAAGGAIIGGILGGKKGAVIGGAVGGGAGTAVVLGTPGEEVRLPAGSAVTVKLLEPVTVRVPVAR